MLGATNTAWKVDTKQNFTSYKSLKLIMKLSCYQQNILESTKQKFIAIDIIVINKLEKKSPAQISIINISGLTINPANGAQNLLRKSFNAKQHPLLTAQKGLLKFLTSVTGR
jgi:hypothetical protein